MSDKYSKVSTPSVDLSDFDHISQADLSYDDRVGIEGALREAQHSGYSTQVGACVQGMSAWNEEVYSDVQHHAETLALLRCARAGIPTHGATMYAPWASCLQCAMAIQAAGIKRVVVLNTLMRKTPERWLTSVEKGLSLLWDYGVRVDVIDVQEGYFGYNIRMDGKEVKV